MPFPFLSVVIATLRLRRQGDGAGTGSGMNYSVGIQVGRVCPGCGREESVPIVWGMPSGDLFELAERGLVVLGGCLLDPAGNPEWSCRACGLDWGREGDPTADEQALA